MLASLLFSLAPQWPPHFFHSRIATVHNCKNIRQRVKTGEKNALNAASAQFTTAKYKAARMSRRIAVDQKVCGGDGGNPGLTVCNL